MSVEQRQRYAPAPKTSALAIWSLVLSLLGACGGFFAAGAVICGHLALANIKASAGRLGGQGLAIAGLIIGYIVLAVWAAIVLSLFFAGSLAGKVSHKKDVEAQSLFAISETVVPTFPALPEWQSIAGSKVKVMQFSLTGSGPGAAMSLRVYMPPGDHPDASLACVLTAPAGTNLLSGVNLDPLNDQTYHDESLPYAEAGMAVVMYSIDGESDETVQGEEAEADEMKRAYLQFKAASAGVINGRNALEFVLARLAMVDRGRIYSAGHSSAATLSLLMAEHEPRLAGSLAYAPAADLEERFKELTEQPFVDMALPGIKYFIKRSSPKTHAAELIRPLFVFFAKDDQMASIDGARALLEKMPSKSELTFRTVAKGGHYQSMIEVAIPEGIEWIRAQDGDNE